MISFLWGPSLRFSGLESTRCASLLGTADAKSATPHDYTDENESDDSWECQEPHSTFEGRSEDDGALVTPVFAIVTDGNEVNTAFERWGTDGDNAVIVDEAAD